MSSYQTLPGFRDFYPEDLAVRRFIFDRWREVAGRYGFQEYDGPPLEPLELYTDKSGPEIVKQLYAFTDKGNREVALRPEMTPTLARMVGAHAGGMRKPIRWFSLPQLFRYERQQRGRLREHFQLNLDIIGEAGVAADAELLAAAIDVLRAFDLTDQDFVARVSDRGLLGALFLHEGVPESRLEVVFNIVDKLERESREELERRLREEAELEPAVVGRVLDVFEERDWESIRSRYAGTEAVAPRIEALEGLFSRMDAMGMARFVRFDLSVVRGLAYYTGIVWELFDARGELRAIAGGGRYDTLLERLSGTDLPALGFGMGDVVLRELLIDRALIPEVEEVPDYYLVAVTPDQQPTLLSVAQRLRADGNRVEYALRDQSVGKQFKNAAAVGARRTLVLGPDEVAAGEAVVREMSSGEESRLSLDGLALA